jgi:2-polyprenyl-3-methyl-5-hydroxy-6-metoxy-1,4-benzoquinol methylase
MSGEDQARWDRKHAASDSRETPSRFLREVLESGSWGILPGKALDLACGKGRNAIFLAARGFHVTAVDISAMALDDGRRRAAETSLELDWRQSDLEKIELPAGEYDLIVKINYLQRSLLPQVKRAVKKGGYVLCNTYLIDQKDLGHPSNPEFLLAHNELLQCFSGFRVLLYREGKFADNGEPAFRAAILAQRIA